MMQSFSLLSWSFEAICTCKVLTLFLLCCDKMFVCLMTENCFLSNDEKRDDADECWKTSHEFPLKEFWNSLRKSYEFGSLWVDSALNLFKFREMIRVAIINYGTRAVEHLENNNWSFGRKLKFLVKVGVETRSDMCSLNRTWDENERKTEGLKTTFSFSFRNAWDDRK